MLFDLKYVSFYILFLIQISFKKTQKLRVYLRNCIYFNNFRDILSQILK